MAYGKAGRYGPEALLSKVSTGLVQDSLLPVNVYLPGTTTLASLWTSAAKTSSASNPVSTDGNGNLAFYADPGYYDLNFTPVGGAATTISNILVPVDPTDGTPGTLGNGTYLSQLAGSGMTQGQPLFAPLFDAYATKGTQALSANADSGLAWNTLNNGSPGAGLSIISGALSNTASGASAAAGYAQSQLSANVSRRAADIAFTSGSTTGGNATLIAWSSQLTNLASIPNTDSHVVFTPTGWQWGIWRSNAYSVIASGNWASWFTWGTATFKHVEVMVGNGWGVILGPDGLPYIVTDTRIGQYPGPWACFEVYQGAPSTDPKASFQNVVADVVQPTGAHNGPVSFPDLAFWLGELGLAAQSTSSLTYGTTETLTYGTADAALDATNLTLSFRAGPSGKVLFHLEGTFFWNNTSGAQQQGYNAVNIGGSQYQTTEFIVMATGSTGTSRIGVDLLVSGLTPGQGYSAQWVGHATAASTLQLLVNGSVGRYAIMRATPV